MPDPEIRYARTTDGVNIAYFLMGSGVPLVLIDLPTSNVQYELSDPLLRPQYEAIARTTTFVRYDHRGFGLSDKWSEDFTMDGLVSDLEAVVDKLGLRRFFIFASRGPTYPIALEYARRHPDRVLKIAAIIGGPPHELFDHVLKAPETDWRWVTEALAGRVWGWDDDDAKLLAAHLRNSTDASGLRRFDEWWVAAADPPDLEAILTPCLFLFGDEHVASARAIASRMPNAVVQVIQETTNRERMEQYRRAVAAFFGGGATAAPIGRSFDADAGRSAIILFIDIADSTAMTERLGDAAFRAASRALDEQLRAAIHDAGGSPVDGKVMGDGVMATFPSAREAIAAAVRCNELSAESELQLHLGIHAGDVIREPGNVYGGAVNIAARICDASAPGEILVSDVVRGMARTSAGVTFEDRGERDMKGVGEPVHIYAVRASD
jgi:class 3 adenylate cyclase